MGDWSELPKELLHLIAQRLESPLYLLRFRSVCSSWRASSSPSPINNNHFPIPTHHSISHTNTTFSLSHSTLLLITPPNNPPWLIKTSHHTLYHPLSRSPLKPHPFLLDLYHLPALDLAHEFLLADTSPPDSLYMEKLVFLPLPLHHHPERRRFVFLTIHVSGKLAFFTSGDSSWTIIPDMPTPFDDVCAFKGNLYAVDHTGRTVAVGLDSGLGSVAEPVFGGDKKFLVECEGELLLVDKYLSSHYFPNAGLVLGDGEDDDEVDEFGGERTVWFDVYRLDQEGKRWVTVNGLGESVLFLGDGSAFSASARDLRVGKGNCIVFRDDALDANCIAWGIGVFSLDDGRISPLSDCPRFSKLFWPPPDWVGLH
ncbi:hypothetical protein RJT34_27597 [Clitoria ternatea]|uniref:F-box domain-containing protein n=1 Tax=Clitoria ternatea TaxID=43366 RepID=A0AAN9FCR0_CLITE